MSGHSKWHNIRLRKGKVDAQRGQLFSKLSKEIIMAARSGVADPQANFRLKIAVEKARDANMPVDTIKRSIGRASGEGKGDALEEIRYEGYGPCGVAVIADAVTDNRNRTVSEIRHIFSRYGGNLGPSGCVAWLFDERGVITLPTAGITQDDLLECAVMDGVVDVKIQDDTADVITEPRALGDVRTAIERMLLAPRGKAVLSAGLELVANTQVEIPKSDASLVLRFLDAIEDHDDVTHVYSSAEIPDVVLHALA